MPEVEGLDRVLEEHPFFDGMDPAIRRIVAGCATNERYQAGQAIFVEGDCADRFFLIRGGSVALDIDVPGREPLVVQTLHDGDLIGWAWLVPPYRWTTSARATAATRLISLDGKCLRAKCEQDSALGYAMHQRFMPIIAERLAATRLRLIDVYGRPGAARSISQGPLAED